MKKELIVGIHSIKAALENNNRYHHQLYCTPEGRKNFHDKNLEKEQIIEMDKHQFQEKVKDFYKEAGFQYQKITSGAFLLTSRLEEKDAAYLYEKVISSESCKILCLDGVTDIHNAGALMRTACFYGVDVILVSGREVFRKTPSFYKIASGATEYVDFVQVKSLSKTIAKFLEMGLDVYALSEHETSCLEKGNPKKACIILGSEEKGISNAVMRLCKKKISLKNQGKIKSLNVSVAGTIVMERVFRDTVQ